MGVLVKKLSELDHPVHPFEVCVMLISDLIPLILSYVSYS